MAKQPKRVQAFTGDRAATHPVEEAVKLVKANAKAKFDETVEIAVNLGVVGIFGKRRVPVKQCGANRQKHYYGDHNQLAPRLLLRRLIIRCVVLCFVVFLLSLVCQAYFPPR